MSAGPSSSLAASSSSPGSPYYRIDEIPGKGKGLVAIRDLPRGTLLDTEKPTLVLNMEGLLKRDTVYHLLSNLNHQQQIAFFSIVPRPAELRDPVVSRIYRFTHIWDKKKEVAMLLRIGLVNHACSPNAMICWEKDDSACHLITTASISSGEEILISYLPGPLIFEDRQKRLQRFFFFECKCRTCNQSVSERAGQDEKVTRYDNLAQSMARTAAPLSILAFVRRVASLSILAIEDRMFAATLGSLVEMATQFCTMGADEHNAKAWVKLWREWACLVKNGEKIKEADGYFDPREHDSWGRKVSGQKQKLLAPPELVTQFFASLELSPTYIAPPPPPLSARQSALASIQGAASANGSSTKKASNGSATSALPSANSSQGQKSASSVPKETPVDSSVASNGSSSSVPAPTPAAPSSPPEAGPSAVHDSGEPSSDPSEAKTGPSKSQKKRSKLQEKKASSLSLDQNPSSSSSLGPTSPASNVNPTSPVVVPPSSPAAASISTDTPASTPTVDSSQSWKRLTTKEKKKEQDRSKNAHSDLSGVTPKPPPPILETLASSKSKTVVEETVASQPEPAPISNKAKKRAAAAAAAEAEAEEARRRKEEIDAQDLARKEYEQKRAAAATASVNEPSTSSSTSATDVFDASISFPSTTTTFPTPTISEVPSFGPTSPSDERALSSPSPSTPRSPVDQKKRLPESPATAKTSPSPGKEAISASCTPSEPTVGKDGEGEGLTAAQRKKRKTREKERAKAAAAALAVAEGDEKKVEEEKAAAGGDKGGAGVGVEEEGDGGRGEVWWR